MAALAVAVRYGWCYSRALATTDTTASSTISTTAAHTYNPSHVYICVYTSIAFSVHTSSNTMFVQDQYVWGSVMYNSSHAQLRFGNVLVQGPDSHETCQGGKQSVNMKDRIEKHSAVMFTNQQVSDDKHVQSAMFAKVITKAAFKTELCGLLTRAQRVLWGLQKDSDRRGCDEQAIPDFITATGSAHDTTADNVAGSSTISSSVATDTGEEVDEAADDTVDVDDVDCTIAYEELLSTEQQQTNYDISSSVSDSDGDSDGADDDTHSSSNETVSL
jgi:hypothetical protein